MRHNLCDDAQPLAQRTGDAGWDVAGRAPWGMTPPVPHRPVRVAVHTMRWLPSGIEAAHIALTAVLLGCALVLALPPETFPTSRVYLVFVETWPHTEAAWAWMFAAPGLLGVAGYFVPLRWRWTRLNMATPLTGAHVGLAVMAYEGNPAGLLFILFGVLAFLGLWRLVAEGTVRWEVL